jgi:anti-anti-sigma regulatory factor
MSRKTNGLALFLPKRIVRGSFRPDPGIDKVSSMRVDRIQNGGHCELRLHGELRLEDARELFERALAEDSSRIVLDFSGCEVEDRALSTLAELLNEARVRLAVRGLRDRQLRLLEYLGATRPLGA